MKKEYTYDNLPKIDNAKIAIISSKWYSEYINNMIEKCVEVLAKTNAEKPEVHTLPGTFELPIAAKTLLDSDEELEAIIAFGIVMKGETMHFEMIIDECTRSFGEIMRSYTIPIIMEVLPVTKEQQIIDRCSLDKNNKGIEAALAAIEMIEWRRKIKDRETKGLGFS